MSITEATVGAVTPQFLASLTGKTVGVTASCLDLKHAGHDLMLKESYGILEALAPRGHVPYLILLLQKDPTLDRPEKNKPVQTLDERLIQARSNRFVSHVVIYETEKELYQIFSTLAVHVTRRFIGEEYQGKQFTGYDLPIVIHWNKRLYHGYSTTALRERVYMAEMEKRARAAGRRGMPSGVRSRSAYFKVA